MYPTSPASAASSVSFKDFVRLFSPAWHAIVMSTGAVTILFNVFPYASSHHGLHITAACLLFLNITFFLLITSLTIARYILFPELWRATLGHPTQSLYLACFPMGFSTILMSALGVLYGYFGIGGRRFVYALWAMWWVDVVVSVVICFGQLHLMFTRQTHSLSRMTLIWLLPIVALIVTSATGSVLAKSLVPFNPSHVYLTLGTTMLLGTIGILLILAMIPIYLLRLVVYKIPKGVAVFSVFMPLGPLGQAGCTYLMLGEVGRQVFPLPARDDGTRSVLASAHAGEVLNLVTWFLGFALWSFATCWIIPALLAFVDALRSNSPAKGYDTEVVSFKVTFWGMVFPNGVYANITIHLASTIDSQVLRVWGAIYASFTIILWVFAMVRTISALRDASLFEELVGATQEKEEIAGGDGTSKSELSEYA